MKYSLKLLLTISLTALSTTWASAVDLPEGTDDANVGEHAVEMTSRPTSATSERGAAAEHASSPTINVRVAPPAAVGDSQAALKTSSDEDPTNRTPVAPPVDTGSAAPVSKDGRNAALQLRDSAVLTLEELTPEQLQLFQLLFQVIQQQSHINPRTIASPGAATSTPTSPQGDDYLASMDLDVVLEEMLRALDKVAFPSDTAPRDTGEIMPYYFDRKEFYKLYECLNKNMTSEERADFDMLKQDYRNAVRSYLDGILRYTPPTASKITIAFSVFVTVVCTVAHFILGFDAWGYKALAPFAGAMTFFLCNQFFQSLPQYIYSACFDPVILKKKRIKDVWSAVIAKYHVPMVELLTYTLLKSGKELLPFQLEKLLELCLYKAKDFADLLSQIQSDNDK